MKGSKNLLRPVTALPLTALPLTTLGVTFVLSQQPQALAQPDVRRGGVGEPGRLPDRPAGAEGQRKEGVNVEQYRKVIDERSQQMRENFVRQSLMRQGVTDEKTVGAILECVRAQEKGKQAVQEKAGRLRPALTNNDAMGDAQFNALFNEYQAALEDYRDSREKAAKELDGKIGYSKKPRLQAVLLMMNIIGDAPQSENAVTTISKALTTLNGQNFNNFNGAFGALQLPGAAGQPGNVFGGQVQILPDGVRVFDNVRVFEDAPVPGFGAPPPNPNGPPPPGDQQANQRVDELRRELSEQIKQLREEVARIKAAQGNR